MENTDLELLERYARGQDADAFAEVVARYRDMVYSTCLRVARNDADAEDAAQECFLKLLRRADTVRTSLSGWLHRTATATAIDRLRSSRARTNREQEVVRMNGHANNGSDWNAVSEHLDKALNDLPDDLRSAVVAYYLGKKTQEEIAAEQGVSAMTISRRLKAGLEELRGNLQKAGVAMTAAVLASLLTERAVQAAPAALVAALDKMSLMAAATSAPTAASAAGAAAWKGVGTVAAGAGKGKLIAGIIATVAVVAGAVTVALRDAEPPAPRPAAASVEQGQPAEQTAEQPAEDPAAASVEKGQPAEQPAPAPNRWPVARNDKMRLLHMSVTFEKADGSYAIREHVGLGLSNDPLSESLELMLETEMKDGLLHLHIISQWRDKKIDTRITPLLPEGATMHLVDLPPFQGLTTEYQVLWRADFVKAGEATRSVAYVARLWPIEEEYDRWQEWEGVVEAHRKSEEAVAEPPAGNTVTYELTYAIDGPQPDESAPAVADIITRRLVTAYGCMPQVEYAPDPPLGKRLRVTVAVSERVPLQDVRELIGMPGTLEFRLVCDDALLAQAKAGNVPAGYRWYTLPGRNREERLLVSDHAEMTGEYIKHASMEKTTRTRETEVHVAFNAAGQEVFGRITGDNVGRQLAMIVDCVRDAGGGIVTEGRLCSAPVIRTQIRGAASISGNFTRAEAERLAAALNSKPLPAQLRLQQQKVNGH